MAKLYIIIILARKRWPSDKASHTCENMVTLFINQQSNFLASADIKAFGRTYLLLLISLALLHPTRVFC